MKIHQLNQTHRIINLPIKFKVEPPPPLQILSMVMIFHYQRDFQEIENQQISLSHY
jgi:hypothetical protein